MKTNKEVLCSVIKTVQMGQVGIRSVRDTPMKQELQDALDSQLREYDAIETEAHNNAIDDDDKIKADYYATTPIGSYYYDYMLPLGSYVYQMGPDDIAIPATEEKAEKCTLCEYIITPELDHTHNHNIAMYNTEYHWIECACGDKSAVTAHSATDDNDCTTADVCSCGYTVRAAKDHTAGKDDGNCTTAIKCTECGKTAVAGATTR